MALLTLHGVTVSLGGHTILRNIAFAIDRGEIVTIVGPNGAGKSTMLRVAIGAIPPSQGDVSRRDDLVIGYVPQRLHVDAMMPLTVRRFLSLTRRRSADRINEVLDQVGLASKTTAQISTLSGGQLQRAMLARALLSDPDLLILDEPTNSLDLHAVYELREP